MRAQRSWPPLVGAARRASLDIACGLILLIPFPNRSGTRRRSAGSTDARQATPTKGTDGLGMESLPEKAQAAHFDSAMNAPKATTMMPSWMLRRSSIFSSLSSISLRKSSISRLLATYTNACESRTAAEKASACGAGTPAASRVLTNCKVSNGILATSNPPAGTSLAPGMKAETAPSGYRARCHGPPDRAFRPDDSAQQGQNALVQLVRLGHHRGAGLLQDLSARQIRGFGGKVGIEDARARCRQVFRDHLQVVDQSFQSATAARRAWPAGC